MQRFRNRPIEKVVLVAPPMKPEEVWGSMSDLAEVCPPLGLCYIAAFVRKKGYDVSIIDGEALQYNLARTVEHIVAEQPDIVGLTCKTLWITSAHQVATVLKKRMPGVPIVAGGHHPTALPAQTIKEFPNFDILVLGEGEETFLKLLQAMSNGQDITGVNGLAFEVDGKPYFTPPRARIKDLDDLPEPAIDLIPPLETHYLPSVFYGIKGASFPLMTSRGCPYKCTFCDRSVYGNRVTFHSPEYVVSLIEHLYHRHKVRYLAICDDNFLLKKSHMFSILDLLESSGMKIKFNCQSRVDTIDTERLQRLKEAGCEQIMFGVESGSQMILDKMNKGVTVKQAKKAIEMTRKAGLRTTGYFILGFPGETEETLKETLALIQECKFDDLMCSFFTPFAGAEAYQEIEEWGTFTEDFENSNALTISFVPNETTTEMLKSYSMKYYNACYMRAYQLRSIPRRAPTMRHLKGLIKSFFIQY